MKEILKLTLSLTLICAIAGAALAFVSQKTAEPREKARLAQRDAKMKLLLPTEATVVKKLFSEDGITFFEATDTNGKLIAYCAEGYDPNGFGGEIKVLVGLESNGVIRGVMVSENSETPGIGSRACNREKSKSFWSLFHKSDDDINEGNSLPSNSYLDSFNANVLVGEFQFGRQTGEKRVNGLVMPISGATISSTAIRNAVNRISAIASKHFHFELPAEDIHFELPAEDKE
ncbi:MAG: FMN-binding protein [Victivallales bacterium]|nr:FMN-binding protein [Victivallales bacterium]